MKGTLARVNEYLKPLNITVLDINAFIQLKCYCGGVLNLDLDYPTVVCNCGAVYTTEMMLFKQNLPH